MIPINDTLVLDEDEIHIEFVRASGPGGQNVNKVSTAVQLFFDAQHSPSLPDEVRARLIHLARRRVNQEGVLIIDARRFRSQEQNRQDALERLIELIRQAAQVPRRRRSTRPSHTAVLRRLEAKRQRSETKRRRQYDSEL